MEESHHLPVETKIMDTLSDLLDSRYKIPGTNIKFGIDALVGFIPGVGDIVSFAMSGALIIGMVRQGAGTILILKMAGNVILDTLVGALPFLGDIFDIWYKANRRNYFLFKKYHEKNPSPKNIWWSLAIALLILIGIFFILLYLIFIWLPGLIWNTPG